MTTVLDSFVLEFGLDHRQFSRDQRQVLDDLRRFEREAESTGTRAEAHGKKVVDVMSSFRREAVGALALFLGGKGIKQFIGDMTQLDAATGKSALTFNMSARELSAWQGAMEQSGGKAESMKATLGGLTQDMNRFMLTGQGTLSSVLRPLGVSLFDDNKQLKDAGVLLLDIIGAMDKAGMDPARKTAFLSMIPGMNEDSINLAMRGRREMEEMVNTSRRLGGTTAESARQAQEYQQATANLDRSMSSLGRTLLTLVSPSLTAVADSMTKLFASWQIKSGSKEDVAQSTAIRKGLVSRFGSPRSVMDWFAGVADQGPFKDGDQVRALADRLYGPKGSDEASTAAAAAAGASAASPANTRSPARSSAEMVAYIRAAAQKRGLDPDVAVKVAASEGLYNYIGDGGSSFGPFQLHYGGVNPKMPKAGLGDAFTKKTGLDARDESTWREQVDFSLDSASAKGGRGWADWYGWKGDKFAGGAGRGGATTTSTTTIGTVVVNTQATDARGIAADIKPQLERGSFSSQFNSGPE